MQNECDRIELIRLSVQLVSAHISKTSMPKEELQALIVETHATLSGLAQGGSAASAGKPAVPVAESVTDDYIICLEDGQELKMLKRYLRRRYNMTPEEYRRKWGLPPDYPMVSPNYSKKRRRLAKAIGLGRMRKRLAGEARSS